MINAWTLEDVRKIREELRTRKTAERPARDETFHAAAALVTSFVFDERLHRGEAGANLKADCVDVLRSDPPRLCLKDSVRRRVLKQLRTKDALRRALDATTVRPVDTVQTMMEAWLEGTAAPLPDLTSEQLSATLQVVDWFSETEIASLLPSVSEVRRLVEHASMLSPLRALTGKHFSGRTTELAAIRSYVGESDAALELRPPLLVYGPGGMGKSSLIAKFILDNLNRLPFIYLDCDRPGLIAMEPVTLLAEAVRQLGIQFPAVAAPAEKLRERWLGEIAKAFASEGDAQSVTTLGRESFVQEFQLLVTDLQLGRRKILLVLDSFEEVQHHSQAVVSEVFQFLTELQGLLPNLRTAIVGRNPVPKFTMEPLEIGELDQGAAQALLGVLGIEAGNVRESLVRFLGGNPLSLRLAAELSRLGDQPGMEELRSLASDIEIQGVLYGRILGHIHDDDVRLIAHPGLILRRITPDIIRRILAGPCGLKSVEETRAQKLFDLLQNELSLVVPDGDAVRHRPDVRRVMLRPLKEAQREKVRQIEEAAVRYYSPYNDTTSRAEEIYHRLSLMQPLQEIEMRWLPGIEDILRPAVDDLEGASRAFLAARVGVELYDHEWEQADPASWETFAANQAQALLDLDRPLEAIRLLRRRAERLPNSPLHWLLAQALRRTGQNLEARQVARQGIGRLLDDTQWDRLDPPDVAEKTGPASPAMQTMSWFAGPDLSGPPSIDEVRIQIQRDRSLYPLRVLVTRSFAGRTAELAALASYALSSSVQAGRPLLICGLAGMGKSALVANFALQHQKQLPFVYVDCARLFDPNVEDALSSIVTEIARQLDLQFPGFDRFRGAGREFVRWTEAMLQDALAGVKSLTSDAGPLLLILDGVDGPLFHAGRDANVVSSFLAHLQNLVPRLRPVLIARRPIADFECEILEIGNLDLESAHAFLAAEGIKSKPLRGSILRLTQASPLALRLVADLVRQQGEAVLETMFESVGQGAPLPRGAGIRVLLDRILNHLADPTLRFIVDAALVLRRITPDVLRKVLAGPARVTIASAAEALRFHDALGAEVALFQSDSNNVLYPRPDVRRIFLQSADADTLQRRAVVHEAAINYYIDQDDLASRAEEVYHRLALGQPLGEIESRWRSGIEARLREAVHDLAGPARAYLEAKLGIAPDTLDWLEADAVSWESYVATRARDLLNAGEPGPALELLKKRSNRLPRSSLFSMEAEALIALSQPREAMSVVLLGLEAWPDDPLLPALRTKCESILGIEAVAPILPGSAPAPDTSYHVPAGVDTAALVTFLEAALPTKIDIVNALSELRGRAWLFSVSIEEIVWWATKVGRLDDLVTAAIRYSPQSEALQDFLEGTGTRRDLTLNRERLPFGYGQLVINRGVLRQFLSGLSQKNRRQRVLVVTGPAGSGKTFTIRVAQWQVRHLMRIAVVHLDSFSSARRVTEDLYRLFGWRWEQPADNQTLAQTAWRCAEMIHARAAHDGTRTLLIFHNDGPDMAPDVRELMIHLTEDPTELAFIFIGLDASIFPPMSMPYLMIEELEDFSPRDIQESLREAFRELNLPSDDVDSCVSAILSSVEPGSEYNDRLSTAVRGLLDNLRQTTQR